MIERKPAMRLLIVDDSNMIRSRISRVVQNGGLANIALVGLARNGAEAVRIARALPHSLRGELVEDRAGASCAEDQTVPALQA